MKNKTKKILNDNEMTGLKDAFKKLEEEKTYLKALEKKQEDFIANISHEFKTPLTSIIGYAETLLADPKNTDETSFRFLRKISKNAKALSNLVDEILQLSRIESGALQLYYENINLNQFIPEMMTDFFEKAKRKNQELKITFSHDPIFLKVDPEILKEILSNLVDNAIKYTDEGGHILVATNLKENHVEISVSDDGIGIPEKYQHRIFERFFRVDKSRSREAGGTGLGLAIVKHLVQAHKAEIKMQSELGQGSVFTLFLKKT